MHGNQTWQFRGDTAGFVLTGHPHTIVDYRERYPASRLYPAALEFKHQGGITLDLFADPANNDTFVQFRRHLSHSHVHLPLSGEAALLGVGRHAEFIEPRNHVAVRAAHRIVEQLNEPPLDLLGDHMLPAAGLNVDFFPRQPDHVDNQALSQAVLAHRSEEHTSE